MPNEMTEEYMDKSTDVVKTAGTVTPEGYMRRDFPRIKVEPGQETAGKVVGAKEYTAKDKETGEERKFNAILLETSPGVTVGLALSVGLKNAMERSEVNEGDHIILRRLDDLSLEGGRRCSQWDLLVKSDSKGDPK